MKIAPADGGNPDADETETQQQYAAKLFIKELDDLQPRNVLIMTNLKKWAKPIFEYADISYEEVNGSFVEATTTYKGSNIIVN